MRYSKIVLHINAILICFLLLPAACLAQSTILVDAECCAEGEIDWRLMCRQEQNIECEQLRWDCELECYIGYMDMPYLLSQFNNCIRDCTGYGSARYRCKARIGKYWSLGCWEQAEAWEFSCLSGFEPSCVVAIESSSGDTIHGGSESSRWSITPPSSDSEDYPDDYMEEDTSTDYEEPVYDYDYD
jgi:hypothetical protein